MQHNDIQDGRPHVPPMLGLHLTRLLDLVIGDHATAVHSVLKFLHRLQKPVSSSGDPRGGGRLLQAWLQDIAELV